MFKGILNTPKQPSRELNMCFWKTLSKVKISRNSVVSVKAGQRLSFLEMMMQTPTFVSVCGILGNCKHRVCVNISEHPSLHMTE